MELSMRVRRAVIDQVHRRYRAATRKQKSAILSEFVQTTGYSRKYACWILAHWGKTVTCIIEGHPVRFIVGSRTARPRSGRPVLYNSSFVATLTDLWYRFDCLCGKRLAPLLRELVPTVAPTLGFSDTTVEQLISVSPATIDRHLSAERAKYRFKATHLTRPGSLLKRSIPVRTFADWDDAQPGFFEADLVAHDGGNSYGDFLCTLTMSDVASGWTEPIAVRNKAQKWVFAGICTIRSRSPLPLLGIDSDNGSEFINDHLVRYCTQEHISFTRSRPYRKNDNCFVEQKNNSVVRRNVGHLRYDTEEALAMLNRLYERLRLFVNFFLPSSRLIEKTRQGSQVSRRYDRARTPFHRLLDSPQLQQAVKEELVRQYATLDPLQLSEQIQALQASLERMASPVHSSFPVSSRPSGATHFRALPVKSSS